jgi:hypothetical protein
MLVVPVAALVKRGLRRADHRILFHPFLLGLVCLLSAEQALQSS